MVLLGKLRNRVVTNEMLQIVMPRFGWRWLLVLSSLPSFVLLIFNGVIPESPRYLCMKSRTTEAYNILQKGALLNQQELPPGMLVSHSTSELNEEFASSEDANLLSARRKTLISESRTSNMSVIFSSKLIRTTLLLWLLYFGNTFSYYGIILLTSELSGGKSDCSTTAMHLKNTKDASLYLDVFVTSLAGIVVLLSAVIVFFLNDVDVLPSTYFTQHTPANIINLYFQNFRGLYCQHLLWTEWVANFPC